MKTWNFVDKSEWGSGPWNNEPDKAHWVHQGIDCLIHRGPSGALCGYVGVPKSHPFYGKTYQEITNSWDEKYEPKQPLADLDVHGGLTFSGECSGSEDGQGICHPKDGAANEDVFWFGFDCAHAGDQTPAYEKFRKDFLSPYGHGDKYRNFDYVKREVEYLADQLLSYAKT